MKISTGKQTSHPIIIPIWSQSSYDMVFGQWEELHRWHRSLSGHTKLSIVKHNTDFCWTNIVKTRHILWVLKKTESHFASVKHPNLQMYYTTTQFNCGRDNRNHHIGQKVTIVIEQFPNNPILCRSRHLRNAPTHHVTSCNWRPDSDAWEGRTFTRLPGYTGPEKILRMLSAARRCWVSHKTEG